MSHPNENHQPNELTPAWESEAREGEAPAEPLADIEQSLAALIPAPPRVDRDRLMFLAGQASVTSDSRPPIPDSRLPTPLTWLWPTTSAALAATSLALAIALLARPTPAERIVYRDRPIRVAVDTPPPTSQLSPPTQALLATAASHTITPNVPAHNYLRTRDVALRHGLDALGTFPSAGGDDSPVPTYRSMLESLSPSRPRAPSEPTESTQM